MALLVKYIGRAYNVVRISLLHYELINPNSADVILSTPCSQGATFLRNRPIFYLISNRTDQCCPHRPNYITSNRGLYAETCRLSHFEQIPCRLCMFDIFRALGSTQGALS